MRLRRKPKLGVVLLDGTIAYPRSFYDRGNVFLACGLVLKMTTYLGVFAAVAFGLVFMEYEYWRAAMVAWMFAFFLMFLLWVIERWQHV